MARRGRGNPDWIRAAEERRQAQTEVVHVVGEAEEMSEQGPTFVETIAALCAPTLGTVVGTMIVEHLPTQLGVRREVVTIGTAAAGVVIALNSQGAVRAAAISMAAQAAAHELLKQAGVLFAAPSKEEESQIPPAATEAAFITRADLHEAMTTMQEDQRKSMIEAVRAVMTELAPVIAAAQQSKRNAAPPRRVPPPQAPKPEFEAQSWTDEQAPPTEVLSQAEESSTPIEPASQSEVSTDAQASARPTPTVGAARVERVQGVYSQLDEQERRLLSTLIAELPPSQANEVAAQLSTLPTDRAVEYARAVLPLVMAKRVA